MEHCRIDSVEGLDYSPSTDLPETCKHCGETLYENETTICDACLNECARDEAADLQMMDQWDEE